MLRYDYLVEIDYKRVNGGKQNMCDLFALDSYSNNANPSGTILTDLVHVLANIATSFW